MLYFGAGKLLLTLGLSDLRFSDFFSSNRHWKSVGVCVVFAAQFKGYLMKRITHSREVVSLTYKSGELETCGVSVNSFTSLSRRL